MTTPLRHLAGRTAITLIQRYTRASPLRRGKLWLSQLGMRFARHLPGEVLVSTVDGGRMYADLSTGMCESLYFLGEYEPGVSGIIREVVRPGQVCLSAERRKDGAGVDAEYALADLLEPDANGVAVHGLKRERPPHQHVQRALHHVRAASAASAALAPSR